MDIFAYILDCIHLYVIFKSYIRMLILCKYVYMCAYFIPYFCTFLHILCIFSIAYFRIFVHISICIFLHIFAYFLHGIIVVFSALHIIVNTQNHIFCLLAFFAYMGISWAHSVLPFCAEKTSSRLWVLCQKVLEVKSHSHSHGVRVLAPGLARFEASLQECKQRRYSATRLAGVCSLRWMTW